MNTDAFRVYSLYQYEWLIVWEVIMGGGMMKDLQNREDGVWRITKCTSPNKQQISVLATEKGPTCFRRSPDSPWEPIGEENVAIAIAINRFAMPKAS